MHAYRYGFNGMEKDDELRGSGNSYDFGARMYDPRVARWLAQDPSFQMYPGHSTYVYALNSPIFLMDPNGKWVVVINESPMDGNHWISFVAEEGDNIETLEKQLGIPKGSLLELHPEYNSLVVTTSTELELENLEIVMEINNTLRSIDSDWNCANVASGPTCGNERINLQYERNGDSDNVNQLAELLASDYESVTESESRIGTIVSYRMSSSDIESYLSSRRKGIEAFASGLRDDGHSESEVATAVAQKYGTYSDGQLREILSNEIHYSVVLLKDKSGEKVQSIMQKHGEIKFSFKTGELNSGATNTGLPYKTVPVSGTSQPFYNEKK